MFKYAVRCKRISTYKTFLQCLIMLDVFISERLIGDAFKRPNDQECALRMAWNCIFKVFQAEKLEPEGTKPH